MKLVPLCCPELNGLEFRPGITGVLFYRQCSAGNQGETMSA